MLIIKPINECLSKWVSVQGSPPYALTNDMKINKRKWLYDNSITNYNFYNS